MSLWGVHIGFAAAVTAVLLARCDFTRGGRWVVIFLSGLWAIVPDLYHFVPGTRPWYKPLVHDSIVANVFWFHRIIDRLDPLDRPLYSGTMIVVFLLVFAVTEVWIQRRS